MFREAGLLLVGMTVWLASAHAEEPVFFADLNLKTAVEDALWVTDPTPTDMLGLTSLNCSQNWYSDTTIKDLTGLEYATNLQTLGLRLNDISDIAPLAALSNLETADLSQNEISDLAPLAGLSHLSDLNLHGNQITDVSPLGGLGSLEVLVLRLNSLTDVSGLAGATNLQDLDISDNRISDLTPLAGLAKLSSLVAWCDRISDLTPLAGLSNLSSLNVGGNQVSDIVPLAGLTHLTDLDLETNKISDLAPLSNLMSLVRLDLRGNPLNAAAIDTYIPLIVANNPGISLSYDNFRDLVTSSTVGGSVIVPGEGTFTYDYGSVVCLEAQADEGYVFAGWSGSVPTLGNPLPITMDQDHQMCASFACVLEVVYVDKATTGDKQENGTADHPFDTIQEAIDVAKDGARVVVRPGIYREHVNLKGKKLQLNAVDPLNPQSGPCATINGTDSGPAVLIPSGSGTLCGLSGFILTQGKGPMGAALTCTGSSPTLRNCLIVGNRSTDPNGAAACFSQSQAVLINCTLADNYGGPQGAALTLCDSNVVVTDCILWGNNPCEILCDDTSRPTLQYCCAGCGWSGTGNQNTDPLFYSRGYWAKDANTAEVLAPDDPEAIWSSGDYHVKSRAGRWSAATSRWLCDTVESLCIDAGDPARNAGAEPLPNGGRINLGAYGGTAEASKSGNVP